MTKHTPIIHVFSEINEGKFKGVKHYNLTQVKNGTTQLHEVINISKNRFFALSNPDYWLKFKDGKKWSKCITGLFKTSKKLIFKGDTDLKTNLLIFKFSDNAKTLTIYFYPDYYTTDLSDLLPTITD